MNMIKEILEGAKVNLERDKKLLPTLIVTDKNNDRLVIGLGNFDSETKIKLMEKTGEHLKKLDFSLQKIVFISDTWVVIIKNTKEKNIIPSEHKDKQEAIMICYWDVLKNKKEINSQFYHRGENETIIWDKKGKEKIDNDSRFYILEHLVKNYLK